MWRKAIAVLAVSTTIIAISVVPSAAQAAGPNEPFLGDLNGDRLLDWISLRNLPDACAVVVQFGRPGGGFLLPRQYVYQVPGSPGTLSCPQLGVAVDLDAAPPFQPGPAELVLGWYEGPPSRSGLDLLVLRNFVASAWIPSIDRPNYIGLADFNGDRRLDVYLWTDQGEGFASYLNPGTGGLVPGPVRYCAGRVQYRLADFDRNGAVDLAVAYADRCDDGANGVAVVLANGSVVNLLGGYDSTPSWTIHVLNADRNNLPDVLTYQQPSGRRWTFLGIGNGGFVMSPVARQDVVTVGADGSVRIPVLVNDWASRRAVVSISTPPTDGTAVVRDRRTVVYRPGPTAGSVDQFSYRITQDGRTSGATVLVRITP
ncbi:Ig-like domain-containing protein [Plantactinospora solaniradicis]|uniref:Ig-like domain-containing protein n=1 Tax=Plantactinospora solaniradicis TaxID=1723736 RepID=A0ABW1KNA4_9ACTN